MPSFSIPSPIGHLTIEEQGDAIVAINWANRPAGNGSPLLAEAARQLQAYFDGKLRDTPVVSRAALAKRMPGPLIVEELDATCVIPPGASAQLDGHGNIQIDTAP